VAALVMLGLAWPLATVLLGGGGSWPLIALIGLINLVDTVNLLPLSFLRAERRPAPYVVMAFVRAVLGSALIVVLVVVCDLGVAGVLLGSLTAAAATGIIGLLLLQRNRRLSPRLDRSLAFHMLGFALPLVPASVAGWTLNLSDRYVIAAIDGRTAVGVYSAGYTVGLAINALAIAPFTLAWGAAYWEIARAGDARPVIARTLTGFITLAVFAAVGLSALSTDLFRWFLTPEFEAGRFVTPFSAFGYVLFGAYTIGTTGLNLQSQTRRLPLILGGVAAANVAANTLLVPPLGYMGAAIATLLSYTALALVGGMVSQRVFQVPWELGRVAALLTLGLALSGAALLGPDHMVWRLACVAAYPLVGLLSGLIPRSTIASLRALLERPRG
jgi:O-antigen/teichoic acid export membrane protein